MTEGDCDADVFVDCISHKAVAAFSKRKIETRIGGASKTISFKDQKLFDFIQKVVSVFNFNGPLDMDFFIKDGEYYLSEINPRFGGAYLHAYGAEVDFFKLIWNNINGIENDVNIGTYDDDILMMMYDDVVIRRKSELVNDNFSIL
jgi:carbamoyl-phosphate synthase large subunit